MGHQSGRQGFTNHLAPGPPKFDGNSSSRLAWPCSKAVTCSNRSNASPTLCEVLSSLPVPRGLGLGAPSVPSDFTTARMSMPAGNSVELEVFKELDSIIMGDDFE